MQRIDTRTVELDELVEREAYEFFEDLLSEGKNIPDAADAVRENYAVEIAVGLIGPEFLAWLVDEEL